VSAERLAILLRAINVGGRKLTSPEFKAALAHLGYGEAKTVGAAGSAVIATEAAPTAVETALEAELAARLGFVTEVFARPHAALAATLSANAFPDLAMDDPSHLLVLFLKTDPTAAELAALRERIVGRERVEPGPGCLYIAFPDGIGTSKLTPAVMARALRQPGTGRNWNTVRTLAGLSAQK
jgi:uncharacterized protein (DUF1697 family)